MTHKRRNKFATAEARKRQLPHGIAPKLAVMPILKIKSTLGSSNGEGRFGSHKQPPPTHRCRRHQIKSGSMESQIKRIQTAHHMEASKEMALFVDSIREGRDSAGACLQEDTDGKIPAKTPPPLILDRQLLHSQRADATTFPLQRAPRTPGRSKHYKKMGWNTMNEGDNKCSACTGAWQAQH